jgi:hypothetical protein
MILATDEHGQTRMTTEGLILGKNSTQNSIFHTLCVFFRSCAIIIWLEANMQQVVLGIKNNKKARFLLDFLKQLDFVEVKSVDGEKIQLDDAGEKPKSNKSFEDILLNAPVLSEQEIDNIEQIGKEISNWQIKEF